MSNLAVCLYDGQNWVVACDANGNVLPAGEGWMLPGSRVNHNSQYGSSIELQVYHFSGVQAAVVTGTTAVYLIKGEKKCLIDGGTRNAASRIIKTLNNLNAFPPDIIILTHSHWDHTQAIPILRKKAAMEQKHIKVMASEAAIPLLEDQSFNKVYDEKENYEKKILHIYIFPNYVNLSLSSNNSRCWGYVDNELPKRH